MSLPKLRIDPLPGYTPGIGRLVCMLAYARMTTLAAVGGLSIAQLDHLHDGTSNSIGALLAHAAAVERVYQALTFDGRVPTESEESEWAAAVSLGEAGRALLRNQPLEHYTTELATVRQRTLEELARRDDAWLDAALPTVPNMNAHWAWFHVAEDEINHRGQIRWLRSRLG